MAAMVFKLAGVTNQPVRGTAGLVHQRPVAIRSVEAALQRILVAAVCLAQILIAGLPCARRLLRQRHRAG